jgi:hypothetical protein
MHTFLSVLEIVWGVLWTVYVWSGLFLVIWKTLKPHKERPWLLNTVWKWAKWPAFGWLLANPVLTIVLVGHLAWYDDLTFLINIWIWYAYRDAGDDDLTKKMKKKAKEIVQQVGGKLVIVPQAA